MEEAESLMPYFPWWLRYAYEAYRLSAYLGKPIYAAGRRTRLSEEELLLLGRRLYENCIVVQIILEDDGYAIKERRPRLLIMAKGYREVEIFFNKPIEGSIIAGVNNDTEKARRIRGGPTRR